MDKSNELLSRLSAALGTIDSFNDCDDNSLVDFMVAKEAQQELSNVIDELSQVHLALNETEISNLKSESKQVFDELNTLKDAVQDAKSEFAEDGGDDAVQNS